RGADRLPGADRLGALGRAAALAGRGRPVSPRLAAAGRLDRARRGRPLPAARRPAGDGAAHPGVDGAVTPRLETARVVLREWREDDFSAYAEMAADPEVARFVGGVLDAPDAWRQMALWAGHWALRGYG